MGRFLRLYQYINILSIDIAMGAVVSALFFAEIFQVRVRLIGLLALGLTVWIIYTIDHLRDAKKILHQASTVRHRFHQQNFSVLTICVCAALVADGIFIFFIRRQVFEWGLVLLTIVILYLIFHRSLRLAKELFVASIYTAGVLLLSITVTKVEPGLTHYLLILNFGCIACANLVLFSWFDYAFDERDDQHSLVTVWGKSTTEKFLRALFLLNFLLTAAQLVTTSAIVAVILLFLMNTVLFLVYVFRKLFEKDDLYRFVGDAVFLIPAFLWSM